jgi:single-strand DNA-binding protein
MSVRFITGNLAADPEVQHAGRVQITKLVVLENTFEYRGSERHDGFKPLNHYVEAKFELGQNAAKTLHKGDAVIVVGHERDASFEGSDGVVYRRVVEATHIGPDLSNATAAVTKSPKSEPPKNE